MGLTKAQKMLEAALKKKSRPIEPDYDPRNPPRNKHGLTFHEWSMLRVFTGCEIFTGGHSRARVYCHTSKRGNAAKTRTTTMYMRTTGHAK